MGVGYSVSPLHRIIYLNTSAMTTRPPVKGSDSPVDLIAEQSGAKIANEGMVRFNSPTLEDVIAWRERLATQYRDQLQEPLTWDEGSPFETSEDVATHGDVLFRYVAAVLDQRGPFELRKLINLGDPSSQELDAAFAEASRRSFGGRFPHLLLGAKVWLPFKSQLMIEEPNWRGHLDRYGSVFHLVDEITAVRAGIVDAQPSAVHLPAAETSDEIMVSAWQTSDTILRLATIGAAKHLPLWTTG